MSKKQPEVSPKSTKNEILFAYQELLDQVQTTKEVTHQEKQHKIEGEVIVSQANGLSIDKIITNLATVKVSVGKNFDTLEQKLTEEYKRFSDLQKAVDIQHKQLQELYEITQNADSLAALLLAQKEYKSRFEKEIDDRKKVLEEEIAQKKLHWKKEQEEHQQLFSEQKEETKKIRERDEEEYHYAIKLTRKKDRDAYEAKKEQLEKELEEKHSSFEKEYAEREHSLLAKETEFSDLKQRVELFPKELDKSVKDAEKTVRESLERAHKHQMDLLTKDIEGERKLNQQTITMLQSKIQEQEEFIKQLTSKANQATHQVQEIALKALDSSRGYKTHCFDENKKPGQSTVGSNI